MQRAMRRTRLSATTTMSVNRSVGRSPEDQAAPPSLHSLRCRFVVGFVRGFIGTTRPSDSSRLPQQLRLLDFLSWPGIALATAGGVRSPRFRRDPFIRDVASDPGRGDGSSRNGTAHVAFGSSNSLGPCDFKDFVAQSHTPNDHCVRFANTFTPPTRVPTIGSFAVPNRLESPS